MPESPATDADGPLGVTIRLNGTALADTVGVLSVRVERDLNRIPLALVTLADGSVADLEFPLTDSEDALPGAAIEISAQFGDSPAQNLFKGIVTAARLRIRATAAPELELTCRDKAIRLGTIRHTAKWEKLKDSEILSKIITDAGLSADVAATTQTADLVQHDCTDWDFLRMLADRNGLVLDVSDGKIRAFAPDSPTATLAVTLGRDILDFDVTLDAAPLEAGVKLSGWNPSSQAAQSGEATAAAVGDWGNVTPARLAEATGSRTRQTTLPYSEGQVSLSSVATARAARVGLAAMQGRCSYQGTTLAGPGDGLTIAGVGARMGGTALVSGVTHVLTGGNWITKARLGLPQDWRGDGVGVAAPGAGGLVAPVQGLHIGTVAALLDPGDSNPFGDATMIQVQLPLSGDPPVALWARFAQPHATASAGIQFLPEIGDEVVVGFFSDDPAAPVVLGALHSGKIARARPATEKNELKGLTTRSGLSITFDDDKKILTLLTPGGHSVEMNDDTKELHLKDLTGNTLTMAQAGVTLESKGTLDLKAQGAVTISSTSGDVTAKGLNVTLDGSVGVKAKGGATSELSAGGQTVVKGAMVMIN